MDLKIILPKPFEDATGATRTKVEHTYTYHGEGEERPHFNGGALSVTLTHRAMKALDTKRAASVIAGREALAHFACLELCDKAVSAKESELQKAEAETAILEAKSKTAEEDE